MQSADADAVLHAHADAVQVGSARRALRGLGRGFFIPSFPLEASRVERVVEPGRVAWKQATNPS